MNSLPLVSLVIPAFNPRFFERALRSAVGQGYGHLEIIVCDDSRGVEIENTVSSVSAQTGVAVRYVRNPRTLGLVGNLKACLDQAQGEFIKLERDSQKYTDEVGTDGQVLRIKMFDDRATVTFTTMQEAAINSVLSTLYQADVNSDNGAGVGAFLLKNRAGLTIHEAQECWVAKLPDVTLSNGVTNRPWMIRIAQLRTFEGG